MTRINPKKYWLSTWRTQEIGHKDYYAESVYFATLTQLQSHGKKRIQQGFCVHMEVVREDKLNQPVFNTIDEEKSNAG